MIQLSVNGSQVVYNSIEVFKPTQTGAGAFSFTIGVVNIPHQFKDTVKISVDGTEVLVGKIEAIDAIGDETDSVYIFQGRDNTATAIDSSFDKLIEFAPNLSLKDLVNEVLGPYNLTAEQENTTDNFTASELPTAEVGENVFKFCDKLARIRSSIITAGNDGNFLITDKGKNKASDNITYGEGGNIYKREFVYNTTLEYDKYTVYSQNNSILDDLNNLVNVNASTGSGVRTKGLIENNSLDKGECKARAEFEQDLDRRRAQTYIAYIANHSQSNDAIWDRNLKVKLQDSTIDIFADYLTRSER
jgi:prophage tail gpP-like protein